MAKITLKFTQSFDTTVVVDVKTAREQLTDLRKAQASEGFNKLPVKNQVLTKLVLEAAERSEEEGIAELLRFNIRVGLNKIIDREFAYKDETYTMRPSPAKVVCHGLEVKA